MHSSVRGYVWRDKFYGTVITPGDTLHVEPLAHTGPVNTRYGILVRQELRKSFCLSVRPAVILLNSSPNLHHSGSDLQAFFAALSALIAFSEYFVKLSEHKLLRLVSDHIFFRRVRNRSVNAYVYRVFSKQRYYNKYSKKVKRRRHVSRMTRRRRHSR